MNHPGMTERNADSHAETPAIERRDQALHAARSAIIEGNFDLAVRHMSDAKREQARAERQLTIYKRGEKRQ